MNVRVDDLTDGTPELRESMKLVAMMKKERRRKGASHVVANGLDAAHIQELARVAGKRLDSLGVNGFDRRGVRFIFGTGGPVITTSHDACKCVDIELERGEYYWYLTSISRVDRLPGHLGPNQLLLSPELYKSVIDRFAKGAGIQVA